MRPPLRIDGQRMHPRSQFFLWASERQGIKLTEMEPIEFRAQMAEVRKKVPHRKLCKTEDHVLHLEDADIPIRIYRPKQPNGITMVYFHGGGYIICCIDSHDTPCHQIAYYSGITVISVEYRLAPEHPFPTPINDGIQSYLKIRERASDFGIDPDRMIVGGDSAGGNLSAVLCQQLRGTPDAPKHQLLVYPPVGGASARPSYDLFAEGCLLTKEWIYHSISLYLPDKDLVDDVRVSPMRAKSLKGLPPATIVVAGFDPLRDDGFAYTEALREAGIYVRFHFFSELFHGFFNLGHILPEGYRAVKKVAIQLKEDMQRQSL